MSDFNRSTALQIIANEKLGFGFGVPERPDEESLTVVLPILRSTSLQRSYITLPETEKVDIADTGRIDRMRFTNKTEKNVFVRSGTMLKGGTQERTITRSAILFPGTTVELDCRCIHASRGIEHGSKVRYGGIQPRSFEQMNYDRGFKPRSQGDFWNNVAVTRSTMMSTSSVRNASAAGRRRRASGGMETSTFYSSVGENYSENLGAVSAASSNMPKRDDLAANLDDFSKSIGDILSKIRFHQNQVGLGLITDKGCETVELFDLSESWQALHDDAVKSVGDKAAKVDTTGVFEYRQDKAVEAVKRVLSLGYDEHPIYEHKPSNGEPSFAVTGLSNDKFTGEIVELDGRVMHLLLLRMVNA